MCIGSSLDGIIDRRSHSINGKIFVLTDTKSIPVHRSLAKGLGSFFYKRKFRLKTVNQSFTGVLSGSSHLIVKGRVKRRMKRGYKVACRILQICQEIAQPPPIREPFKTYLTKLIENCLELTHIGSRSSGSGEERSPVLHSISKGRQICGCGL